MERNNQNEEDYQIDVDANVATQPQDSNLEPLIQKLQDLIALSDAWLHSYSVNNINLLWGLGVVSAVHINCIMMIQVSTV